MEIAKEVKERTVEVVQQDFMNLMGALGDKHFLVLKTNEQILELKALGEKLLEEGRALNAKQQSEQK